MLLPRTPTVLVVRTGGLNRCAAHITNGAGREVL